MTFCGKQNRGYAACLKIAVNVLVDKTYKLNFYRCVPTCVRIRKCRSL